MEHTSVVSDKKFSKDWADRKLKYFACFLRDGSTWSLPHNRHNKVIVVRIAIELLDSHGFVWHADRLRNHLNLWKKSCIAYGDDTPEVGGGSF